MNLREPPIRSQKYLRGSKDESCKLRIVCDGYGDNVVPCHARDRHTGRGQKASDLSVIDGCQACHDVFDMRAKLPSGQFLTSEEWLFYALRGLQDTIESRARRQIIIVPLEVGDVVNWDAPAPAVTEARAISDGRLREILAAAEVLHREEWGFVDSDDDHRILIVRAPNDAVVAASTDYKRASFIADCDPSTVAAMAEELLAARAKLLAYETAKLPCDVKLPPATTISAGCNLTTLIVGLEVRGMAKITEPSNVRP